MTLRFHKLIVVGGIIYQDEEQVMESNVAPHYGTS
jgi:hypothetical protein